MAVDSSQVKSAGDALDKMAASGDRAEDATNALTKAAAEQGRSLSVNIVGGAAKATVAVKALADAEQSLANSKNLDGAVAGLDATRAGAISATAALNQLGSAAQDAGAKAQTALTPPVSAGQVASVGPTGSVVAPAIDASAIAGAAVAINQLTAAEAAADSQAGKLSLSAKEVTAALSATSAGSNKAVVGFKDLAAVQAALGPNAAKQIAAALAETDAEARAATASITALGNAGAVAGAKVTSALSAAGGGAGGIPPTNAGTISTPAPPPGKPSAPLVDAAATTAGATAVKALGSAVKSAKTDIDAASTATHSFSFETAAAKRELLVLGGELARGNFSRFGTSLLVLAQRTGAASLLFSPLALGIGAVTAAVGTLAVAFAEGALQSQRFTDSLINTGNFAGVTEGQFNATAKSISASTNQSVSSIRDFEQALINTGQIGPQVLAQATAAAVAYSKATGKTADEVAKDFAKMAEAPTKFAREANQSLNFLSASQIQAIKAFEDTGRAADAEGVFFDALAARIPKLNENLSGLGGFLHQLAKDWKDFWDSAQDSGRTVTPEDRLASVRARIAGATPQNTAGSFAQALEEAAAPGATPITDTSPKQKALDKELETGIVLGLQGKQELATAQANTAELQKQGDAARKKFDIIIDGSKTQFALQKAREEDETGFTKAASAGAPLTDEQKQIVRDATTKKFTTTTGKGAAARFDKADLDADLKVFKDHLQAEQDALTLADRLLQGEYRAGNVSLAQFYQDRAAIDAAGLTARIAELEQERARINDAISKENDPAKKRTLESKRDEVGAQEDKARVKAAGDQQLANQEAAASFKALNDQVTNYRASLLQLAGDESGAAALRTAQAIKQAQELAAKVAPNIQSAGDVARLDHNIAQGGDISKLARGQDLSAQVAQQAALLQAQDAITEAKRRTGLINESLSQQEDRIALAQKTGQLNEFQALQQEGVARQAIVTLLEEQVKKQEDVAAAFPQNLQLQLDTSKARLALDQLKADLDPLKDKFDNLFKDSGANALADLLNGSKGFKAAATDFLKSISTNITNSLSKIISDDFFGKSGPASGVGGFFADLFRPAGSAATAPKTGIASLFSNPVKEASGTDSFKASLLSLQTTGVDPATASLTTFTDAVNAASTSLGASPAGAPLQIDTTGTGLDIAGHGFSPAKDSGEQSITDLFKDTDAANAKAALSTDAFSKTTASAANSVLGMAAAAARGNQSLGLLPALIGLFQTAVTSAVSSGGGGSGGGLIGSLAGSFSRSGSSGAGIDSVGHGFNQGADSAAANVSTDILGDDLALAFHTGGIVGKGGALRAAHPEMFDDAAKYHQGGTVLGKKQIPGLKADEVPAILLANEEVLTAKDPRHRDNIAPALLKQIEDGQGQPTTILAQVARSNVPDSQDAPPGGEIARMLDHDKSTHHLSPLTKYLIGSPATVQSLITELSKESDFRSVTSLREIKMGPARADGGPVWPNTLHQVNERGPELLEVAGNQYLMTGNQGGTVTPAAQSGPAQLSVTNHFILAAPASKTTQSQIAAISARAASNAMRRGPN